MAYYPNYPQQFYPQYQQMVQPQMMQPQRSQGITDDRIWVQGEAGMKGYIVAPGCTVPLWDTETPTIWLKSSNYQGVPAVQKIRYSYDNDPETNEYDKRLKGIEERLAALEKEENENV